MCGICGAWGGEDDPTAIRNMKELLRYRGPDAEGEFASNAGRLGHRRLSIIDPAGGDQPLYSESGRQAIVANGEIYNFRDLREGLVPRHVFRTTSDSESVLHLYEEQGTGAASALDGMFAFAIADGDDLYLARDPIGIKPLYTGRRGRSLVFASELKALAGIAEEVREFPPGHWFHTACGTQPFYGLPESSPENLSLEEHVRRVRVTLEQAVVKRLMSDVPLGAFLSGGLDSSIIAALARRHLDELQTFSVGVEGSEDLEAARLVAKHIGSLHHEYVLSRRDVEEKLGEIVYLLESFDQDLVRSAVPCYFTARLAAEHVKVVLTGEGADELFAGYDYYKALDAGIDLEAELRRSVGSMHNVNLQRVDRMTMAHSIEGRVPFLDVAMIEIAQAVPADLKLRGGTEKWILRHAFEDLLPREIAWRDKRQFDEGSGTVGLLTELTERLAARRQLQSRRAQFPDAHLRSREECAYHALLLDAYPRPETILDNVARWSDRPRGISNAVANGRAHLGAICRLTE
jgi:asparagine synthase (glutamine-hydrolysing)